MGAVGNPNVVEEERGDGSVEVWNHSQVPTSDVIKALPTNFRSLVDSLGRWADNTRSRGWGPEGTGRRGTLFERDRFVTPNTIFDQMRLAYDAVETDDIVAGVVESTEALAFGKMDFYADDPDEQDVYNQVAADIDLDSRMREMWREMFTVSQFYCAVWWTTKTYKVRGKGRKKSLTIRCPKQISILDPLKIVPVGMPLFGQERLAWIATRSEYELLLNSPDDQILKRLVLGPYKPDEGERVWLSDMGVTDTSRLFELNPANVFRHTATRPHYQMFASLRMKSIFELLDLKHQLRSMDRAHLIGGTNFIILITQGSDAWPAKAEEIQHLQAAVRTVAQSPVLVGDHRLDVKIITPQVEQTLGHEKYDTIDTRISARLYQMFLRPVGSDRGDTSDKLSKIVASGMESRRKMLRRSLEEHVINPMFEQNDNLLTEPHLMFHPKAIALEFDANLASFMLELRTAREISRHTILSQFELSEQFEADMLKREKELYDDTFQTINPNNQGMPGGPGGPAPGGGPAAPGGNGGPPSIPVHVVPDPAKKAAPVKKAAKKTPAQVKQVQRQAGRRKGGAAPGTGQGQAPRKAKPVKKAAAAIDEFAIARDDEEFDDDDEA